MVNLTFNDLISKRLKLYQISDELDEISYYAQRDFEDVLYDSPSATSVKLADRNLRVIINDVKYGVELEDDKYMLTRYSDVIALGSYAEWNDESWIVASKERFTDKGHRSYRLKRCNGVMKFTNKKGEIVSVASHIYNKLFYTEGIDKYTHLAMPDGLCQVVLPNTEVTKDISRNMRIVIGDQVFMVTYVDRVTQEGIAQITLSEIIADIKDDFDNQVADSPYVDGIEGRNYIFLNNTSKYSIDEDAVEWKIVGDGLELVSTASRYVLVKGIKEGEHQLMAICDGKIYRKSIQVNYQNFD